MAGIYLAYEGSLHSDWLAQYGIRLAANAACRELCVLHARRPEQSPAEDESRLAAIHARQCGILPADVGVAMGCSGTDVAREAADIVLLDDNFASIVAGIEEGRGLFANMQKFTTYVLASNVPEIVPFLAYVALPVPLALTVVQILSIDLGTDLLPAIGLGQEPPEPDVMRRPPRSADQRLLSASVMTTAYLFLGVLQAAWAMAMFFSVLYAGGWQWGTELSANDPLYRAATGATLASVIVLQIANVVGRRTQRTSGLDRGLVKNYLVLAGMAVEAAFIVGLVAWKPLQNFLGTGPLSGSTVAVLILGAPLLLALDLGRKRLLGRHLRLRCVA